MAQLGCSQPMLIEESSLSGWKVIDSGGFGQIYKARHLHWCYDVAIKLLHYDDGWVKNVYDGAMSDHEERWVGIKFGLK